MGWYFGGWKCEVKQDQDNIARRWVGGSARPFGASPRQREIGGGGAGLLRGGDGRKAAPPPPPPQQHPASISGARSTVVFASRAQLSPHTCVFSFSLRGQMFCRPPLDYTTLITP